MSLIPLNGRKESLNVEINLEKYKHHHRVEDLNLGGPVLPQLTQLSSPHLLSTYQDILLKYIGVEGEIYFLVIPHMLYFVPPQIFHCKTQLN
jgi:hypothetical protein